MIFLSFVQGWLIFSYLKRGQVILSKIILPFKEIKSSRLNNIIISFSQIHTLHWYQC